MLPVESTAHCCYALCGATHLTWPPRGTIIKTLSSAITLTRRGDGVRQVHAVLSLCPPPRCPLVGSSPRVFARCSLGVEAHVFAPHAAPPHGVHRARQLRVCHAVLLLQQPAVLERHK
eukprot:scaffold62613_cov84-Phaeocystis_antarctica.AAC.4